MPLPVFEMQHFERPLKVLKAAWGIFESMRLNITEGMQHR